MNKVIFIGRLTRDPELSHTNNGIAVCKFSLAINRKFTSEGGEREADFFNVVAWRGLAENCAKYLSKGKLAAVSGNIQTRSYEDKSGVKRYVTEVMADDVEFLSPRGEDSDSGYTDSDNKPKREKRDHPELKPVTDEDLPF